MEQQKKFTAVIVSVVIVAIVVGAGIYIWQNSKSQTNQAVAPIVTNKTDLNVK